jgi:hypothetical protein
VLEERVECIDDAAYHAQSRLVEEDSLHARSVGRT